jgi:Fe2+ transport system protein B
MTGTILENLSGRKLTILVSSLMLCQLVCFLIGGLIGKFCLHSRYIVYTSSIHVWFLSLSSATLFRSDDSRDDMPRQAGLV